MRAESRVNRIAYCTTLVTMHGYQFPYNLKIKNEEALLLYERMGYRLIGEREDRWLADLPDGGEVEVIDNNGVLQKNLRRE
jgi:hypothetical protein